MTLQNTFYVIGIIFMALYTLLLIAVITVLVYIRNKIAEIYHHVESYVNSAKGVVTHPEETGANIGADIVHSAAQTLRKPRRKRRK